MSKKVELSVIHKAGQQATETLEAICKNTPILFTFNFVGGGYNQILAPANSTAAQVIEAARPHLGEWADKINPQTITALATKAAQDNYWRTSSID